MKGIELCADCAYYNMKSHKCTRGCKIDPDTKKGEDIHFFVDCPLTDVQPVKHGKWIYPYKDKDINQCSECRNYVQDKISNVREMFAYCPFCGAKMDGGMEKND